MGMRLLLGRSDTVVRRERLVRSDREDEGRRSEVLSPSPFLLASLRFVAISLAERCADYIPPRMDCAPQLTAGSQSDSSDAGHESMADPHPPVYDFLASAVDF